MKQFGSNLKAEDEIAQVCTAIAASIHLLLALCGTPTQDAPKEVTGKKRARQRATLQHTDYALSTQVTG